MKWLRTFSSEHRLAPGPKVSIALTIAGTAALAMFVSRGVPPIALPGSTHFFTLTLGALALWVGMVCALGAERDRAPASYRQMFASLAAAFARGAERAWPAALPLIWLGIKNELPSEAFDTHISIAFALVLMDLGWGGARALRAAIGGDARNSPLPPRPTGVGFAPSELCSLLFCLCATVYFVVVALHAEGSADNDAAYYFGVARHIVDTGRFEEPIVWQFLVPSKTVAHVPFEYWQGLTTLVLLPPMFLFGATSKVALVSMALFSGLALGLLWYLIVVASPLRHRLAQSVALLAFAMSPAMKTYRFDTESIAVFHLVLLAALVALASGRLMLAVCVAFLLYLTRGDGAILCVMIWAACLNASLSLAPRHGTPQWQRLLLVMLLVTGTHIALCFALYGAPTPPAARVAATVSSYFDLFRLTPNAAPRDVLSRLTPDSLGAGFTRGWNNLLSIQFFPQQLVFVALILAMGWRRPRWSLTPLIWCLLFLGSGLVTVATGMVFAPHRTLYTMVPLVMLASAAAFDQMLDYVDWRGGQVRWLGSLMAAGALAYMGAALGELRPYGERAHLLSTVERDARALQPVLKGAVVATTSPWSVIAVTDSPAIMIPDAKEAELEALFRRYGVKWILLGTQTCIGRAVPICNALRNTEKATLGTLKIVERRKQGSVVALRLGMTVVTKGKGSLR